MSLSPNSEILADELSLLAIDASHFDTIMMIDQATALMPWPERIVRQCLRDDYVNHLLMYQGQAIGFSICSTGAGEAHLQNIAIHPDHQGRGYGRWLLTKTVEILSQQGLHQLFLEVRASNKPAIKLYQRFGFENVGLRKGYYDAPVGREDAYVYLLAM